MPRVRRPLHRMTQTMDTFRDFLEGYRVPRLNPETGLLSVFEDDEPYYMRGERRGFCACTARPRSCLLCALPPPSHAMQCCGSLRWATSPTASPSPSTHGTCSTSPPPVRGAACRRGRTRGAGGGEGSWGDGGRNSLELLHRNTHAGNQLYGQLVRFPTEVIPIMDVVLTNLFTNIRQRE